MGQRHDELRRNLSAKCPKCGAPMRLVAIEPEFDSPARRAPAPTQDVRSFECVKCGHKRSYPLTKSE